MALCYKSGVLGNTETEQARSLGFGINAGLLPGDFAAVRAALDTLTLGTLLTDKTVDETILNSVIPVRPASTLAQVEKKYDIRWRDNVTLGPGGFEIACADLSLLPSGSEFLDITTVGSAGEILASWLNANAQSYLGNAITVTAIKFITR